MRRSQRSSSSRPAAASRSSHPPPTAGRRLLLRRLFPLPLGRGGREELGQPRDGAHPGQQHAVVDDGDGGRGPQHAAGHQHQRLLGQCAAALAQARPQPVDGGLALHLLLLAQRDIGHLRGRVEEAELGRLTQQRLRRTQRHCEVQARGAAPVPQADGAEEGQPHGGHRQRRDQRARRPAQVLHHVGPHEDDQEGGHPHHGGEVPHEPLVVQLLRVLQLQHALEQDVREVDGQPVGHDQRGQAPQVLAAREHAQGLQQAQLLLLLLGGHAQAQLTALGRGRGALAGHQPQAVGVEGADGEAAGADEPRQVVQALLEGGLGGQPHPALAC
mmetsp:Transcript_30139/g.44429  ORF Transcript_30139/g.44429 Transcript_30139/m.44429 type:complete len:329 (+) Transcript_30139:580-1566(+)